MIRRYRLSEMSIDQILCRDIRAEKNVDSIVDEIIADVRAHGDQALRRYAEKFDHAKLEALEDIVDDCMDSGKKVVVFARFIPEIDAISKMLRKKDIGHAIIKGDVTDRAEQVQAFQTNPEIKVFIGQLATTGMGLTLTAGTVAVYYSLDFSYANYEQSRARIRRIGQTQRGVYIHLVARGTIDEHVMSALQHKGDIAKMVVDDYKKILGGNPL